MSTSNKIIFNPIKAALFSMLLFYFTTDAQTLFSTRLNVGGKTNNSICLRFHNDTFAIPVTVFETFNTKSTSLLKVTKGGSVFSQKRFKPANVNYDGGFDLLIKNNKHYVTTISGAATYLQKGFFVFDKFADTLFTKGYGDTTYYNLGSRIQPYLKTKDKLLLFGITDSTCGPAHSGDYKPVVRVVDTNGVLYQTKIYLTTNKYRTVMGCDTAFTKGYVFSGSEQVTTSSPLGKPYVVKLDSNLNQKWITYLSDNSLSFLGDIKTVRGGKFILTHNRVDSMGGSNYYERVGLTKIDTNGTIIWQKYYGTKQLDITAIGVEELKNGDYLVCGMQRIKYTSSVSQIMGFLLRTDSAGNIRWRNNYVPTFPLKDTISTCYLYDVCELPDKSLAAVGWAGASFQYGFPQQTWLLRVDSTGCLVPGCTPMVTNNFELKEENLFVKAYPNPFKDELNVAYNLDARYKNGNLAIIEPASGKVLMNYPLSELIGSTGIKTENLVAGIYMVKISGTDAPEKFIKIVNIK